MHDTRGTLNREHEAAFVARLRRRDPSAFEELVSQHAPWLLRVAECVLHDEDDVRDALQSALLSAYRGIDTFEASARLSTWLYRIVTNASLGLVRFRRMRREQSLEACLTRLGPELRVTWDADAGILRAQQLARLHEAVRRLPDPYRRIIRCELADVDLRACARSLGITLNAAKLRRLRARKRLRALLAGAAAAGAPALR